ncbi:MAG: superfamily endonuclease [Myxococcaceae bacterium]|jgi:transposase|nr:superfamily endonuclease [Myxococcaceae bacterium]MEA2752083.1 superfamily endonuclease [Myxococcales bacterium]
MDGSTGCTQACPAAPHGALKQHKMNALRQAIVDGGASVIDLPTYSPELDPIEMLWADMKRSRSA